MREELELVRRESGLDLSETNEFLRDDDETGDAAGAPNKEGGSKRSAYGSGGTGARAAVPEDPDEGLRAGLWGSLKGRVGGRAKALRKGL